MPICFKILDEERYLRVVSTGSCEDLNQLKEYILGIYGEIMTSGHKRVFVDEIQLDYNLPTINSFYSGRFVSQLELGQIRIAVLTNKESWNEYKFWETVAVNRGVLTQVFVCQDRAEEWILN